MKDYSKMSDFEINKEVEKLTGMYCEDFTGRYMPTCDYCNNPSDAWPIIVKNGISINHGGMLVDGKWIDYWYCGDGKGNCCNGESPLRAAMIVYLMMNDEQK